MEQNISGVVFIIFLYFLFLGPRICLVILPDIASPFASDLSINGSLEHLNSHCTSDSLLSRSISQLLLFIS
jgi:hypothetical protein